MLSSSGVPLSQPMQARDGSPTQDEVIEIMHVREEVGTDEPYSSFSLLQKSHLAYAASISATLSGWSSFITYPAITALAQSLHTSTQAVNYTITAYLVTSVIAPSFLDGLEDRMGRLPITILALALYLGANLEPALQNTYMALLVLRCLQSAGASSTITLC